MLFHVPCNIGQIFCLIFVIQLRLIRFPQRLHRANLLWGQDLTKITNGIDISVEKFLGLVVLYLHGHLPSILHDCSVHLADRGTSEGHRIKVLESFSDRFAHFLFYRFVHRLYWAGRDVILQLSQLPNPRISQCIGHPSRRLPVLSIHALKLSQVSYSRRCVFLIQGLPFLIGDW